MAKVDYADSAKIISQVVDLVSTFSPTKLTKRHKGFHRSYSKQSKELAAKVLLEWSNSLKKNKKTSPQDLKIVSFLEGFVKILV